MPTLNWIGKDAVINHHKEVPFHLLRCDPKRSVDSPLLSGEGSGVRSDNLLVQGDNLLALKALLPHYAGQVKCIYIDPPYNTGNEGWVYNDNVNSPEMKAWLGKTVGGEAEDLSRHDKWLCMMYPRLVLLREMLREDGVIFISIDDEEVSSLRLLLDEVFGRDNFVECITWNKRIPKNDAGIGNIHEYILVYRKSVSWKYQFTMAKDGLEKVFSLLEDLRKSNVPILEAEKQLRNLYKLEGYDRGVTLYNSLNEDYRPWGKINLSWPNANTFGPRYVVPHPKTRKPVKVPDRGWRWTEETFKNNLGEGKPKKLRDGSYIVGHIWFDVDENTQPSYVKFLDDVDRILLRSVISLKSDGGIELENIFGKKAKFAYPKPTNLIQILVDSIEMKDGDIVFDSFAGSGTTGHAVLKQNAQDGIQRKFILIEMDENISSQITAERMKYVSKDLSGGFRFCTLGESLFNAEGQVQKEVTYEDLARHIYFTETGQPLSDKFKKKFPLLGIHNGVAVYLLYNGVMKDKSRDGGNILTRPMLAQLPAHDGAKVIYGNGTLLSENTLRSLNIIFKQVPYEIKVS